jgi:hypothetical protein
VSHAVGVWGVKERKKEYRVLYFLSYRGVWGVSERLGSDEIKGWRASPMPVPHGPALGSSQRTTNAPWRVLLHHTHTHHS